MAQEVTKKGRVGRYFRELGSELKKVSWASFKEVVKKTGIVLVVVLAFLVLVFLFDIGVGYLYDLLVASVNSGIRALSAAPADLFRSLF